LQSHVASTAGKASDQEIVTYLQQTHFFLLAGVLFCAIDRCPSATVKGQRSEYQTQANNRDSYKKKSYSDWLGLLTLKS
jgi:hypothetical protein